MGVKGLWSIVSPVGVRVNPEIFTGKRIAIDVSIWLYELTYANNLKSLKNNSFDNMSIFNDLWLDFSENMNNEIRSDNLKKAHLYFFFLRICKLLYYNIRPIFIFDGDPPELKRKTIFQRNIKRRNYEEKFKKTAEKLIYNYYQRTLLKSLKSQKNISSKKKESEKKTLNKNVGVKKCTTSNLVEIYDSIREKDASLSNMVEQVGNVEVSVKDVLTICNDDDLRKIQNKVLMIADLDVTTEGGNKDNAVNGKNTISEHNNMGEEKKKNNIDEHIVDGDLSLHITLSEEEENKKRNNIMNNLDNEINEQIVRKKHIARKKYYENIPKDFKGFLSMRRPVDIIDISDYNTDLLEFTDKVKHVERKYSMGDAKGSVPEIYDESLKCIDGAQSGIETRYNKVGTTHISDGTDGNVGNNDEVLRKGSAQEPESIDSSSDDSFVSESQNTGSAQRREGYYEGDAASKEEENSQGAHRRDINILEMPSMINSSNIFLDGKDEYKVYYVNNEEIKIPLFKEINKEIFEKLPIKLQYQILQDIKEEWYTDNRIKAIKAKDDMDIFSQVQLETYVRMIKTDFEIEKLKIKMAENIQNVEGELIVNKELAKNFEGINIRDYNDIKKKKKKKKKKYINDILNNCYFEQRNEDYDDLYIKEEGQEKEVRKGDEQIGELTDFCYDGKGGMELKMEKFAVMSTQHVKKEEEEGEEKKSCVKMEDLKRDLLMNDQQIFGENFFEIEKEDSVQVDEKSNTNNSSVKLVDVYKEKSENVEHIELSDDENEQEGRSDFFEEKHIEGEGDVMTGEKISTKEKNDEGDSVILEEINGNNAWEEKPEQMNVIQAVDDAVDSGGGSKKTPGSHYSSDDDFENCVVEEKEIEANITCFPPSEEAVIDLTSEDGKSGAISTFDIENRGRYEEEKSGREAHAELDTMANVPTAKLAEEKIRGEMFEWRGNSPSDDVVKKGVPCAGESSNSGNGRHMHVSPHKDKEVPTERGKKKGTSNEQKKEEKVQKFMSKDQINDLILKKGDISEVGKVNLFERLLRGKELMDQFNVEMGEAHEREKKGIDQVDIGENGCTYEREDYIMDEENTWERTLEGEEQSGKFPSLSALAQLDHIEDDDDAINVIDAYMSETKKEKEELVKEYKKLKKNNIEINEEMNDDIKILLDFFGIPYVQSPCEAEAQCSYLNNKNYCDAIISDDSDVIVFSGKTVIKNFFNRKKTVEVYEKKIIESKLGLYQDELINISLLCGCDYTIGVHGVGIVNALEIIKAFPTFEDLKTLKELVSNPFMQISKCGPKGGGKSRSGREGGSKSRSGRKGGSKSRSGRKSRKGRNGSDSGCGSESSGENEPCNRDDPGDWDSMGNKYSKEVKHFLETHKNYKLNWIFPQNFPDREVYKCFKYPKVCTDIKSFQWYFPNIKNITKFLNKTTNIAEEKIFNVLDPILKKYDIKVRTYQLKIEDFFPIIERKRKSVDDLIDIIRENKKGKKKNSKSTTPLGRDITSLIDIQPAGIIRSKRMTSALEHIKKRKDTRERGGGGE
ncbi:DNA repair protein RAD2, putative (RAD2) [Plasmodium ovale wallikeri]|uniref:DNA repair protein RAD2, putative (RAD2) n=1 Tax=Plasmodium ovale wallikeri TaxID=864142 RepID=A0A1A8YJW7_PLAOA|nr:DNA repair protein RAD2, putative (RAD2) [Plasmodium ovale wallikeri]